MGQDTRVIGAGGNNLILENGNLVIKSSGHDGTLSTAALTADRTYTLPNKSGTVAMTTDIPTNNNQLTNGAGYITATLSNEQVQDIVGGMVSGNTESGITVSYQDADGTLDFSVASQTDNNFTNALKSKLDGIAAGATNVTNNNQLVNGAGYLTAHPNISAATSSNNSGRTYIQDISVDSNGHVTGIETATETVVDTNTTYSAGSGLDLSGDTFSLETDLRGEIEYVGSSRSYIRAKDTFTTTLPLVGTVTLPPQLTFFVDSDPTTNDGARVVFESDGDVQVQGDVLAFQTTVSDKKFKNNIEQIQGGLDKVKKLRGVEFDWNATSRKGTRDVGLIAQEVEEVIPEVVKEKVPCVGEFCENTEKYKTVDYTKLVPVLIEAIKDLSEEVEELKKKLS